MTTPRVVDVFLFNDEFDMLRLRLNELKPYVSEFVVVEAPWTFSGLTKPLYFKERAGEFSDYPITALSIEEGNWSAVTNPWVREGHCRNFARKYLLDTCSDSDIIVLSDIDEIPDFRKLDLAEIKLPLFCEMEMFYYNFTCHFKHAPWKGTVMFNKNDLARRSLSQFRMDKFARHPTIPTIRCGWHISYFMTPEKIADKLRDFSHQEYNNPNYNQLDYIKTCIKTKVSIFNKDKNRTPEIGFEYQGTLPRTYNDFPEFMKSYQDN